MTKNKTTTHAIELWVETPEEYSANDVIKEIDSDLSFYWGNSDDDETRFRNEWKIRSIEPFGEFG